MMPHPVRAAARHVFVYGTLRKGERNDITRYLPMPRHVADGHIAGTLYDLGSYPGVVLGGPGRVAGEIYAIASNVEAQLDLLEEVQPDGSGEYIKREVAVTVGDDRLACLVYEIHPGRIEGRTVVAGGDWRARIPQR
ncbi:MAG: gamma-glutamylcyclotransferase family protein [Variovorax sp.]